MTKRDMQASDYAAESYGKGDGMRGDSPTNRCASQPRNGALGHQPCQDLLQKNLTLTDEERWCLKEMLMLIAFHHEDHQQAAFILRDLLRRTK